MKTTPSEYIKGMLERPGMYVRSPESLEDVYWALNCIRGTNELSRAKERDMFKAGSLPVSSLFENSFEGLEKMSKEYKIIEEEILKEIETNSK